MADNHWKRPQTTNGLNNYKEVKMSLIIAGGWVMVPLLLISIIVLALVIDRSLSYIWNPLPDADQQRIFLKKFKGEFAAAETYFSETPWLKNYASALGSSEKMPLRRRIS